MTSLDKMQEGLRARIRACSTKVRTRIGKWPNYRTAYEEFGPELAVGGDGSEEFVDRLFSDRPGS